MKTDHQDKGMRSCGCAPEQGIATIPFHSSVQENEHRNADSSPRYGSGAQEFHYSHFHALRNDLVEQGDQIKCGTNLKRVRFYAGKVLHLLSA